MLVALGLVVTLLGLLLAWCANRFPVYRAALERWGGGCFVTGLTLLAFFFMPVA